MKPSRSEAVSKVPNRLVRLTSKGETGGVLQQTFLSDCGEVQLELVLRVPRHNATEAKALINREASRWIRSLGAVSR